MKYVLTLTCITAMKKYKYSMSCGHFDESVKTKSLKIETSSHSDQQRDQESSKKQLVCNCWLKLLNNHNDPVKLAKNLLTVKNSRLAEFKSIKTVHYAFIVN